LLIELKHHQNEIDNESKEDTNKEGMRRFRYEKEDDEYKNDKRKKELHLFIIISFSKNDF